MAVITEMSKIFGGMYSRGGALDLGEGVPLPDC